MLSIPKYWSSKSSSHNSDFRKSASRDPAIPTEQPENFSTVRKRLLSVDFYHTTRAHRARTNFFLYRGDGIHFRGHRWVLGLDAGRRTRDGRWCRRRLHGRELLFVSPTVAVPFCKGSQFFYSREAQALGCFKGSHSNVSTWYSCSSSQRSRVRTARGVPGTYCYAHY